MIHSAIDKLNFSLKEYKRRIKSAQLYERKELNRPGDYYSKHSFDYYRCIFIHVPKTAGISVSKSLFGHNTDHADIDWFLENYGKHTVNSYFKFAFVRNPWDRLYSAFHFLEKGGMYPVDKEFYELHLRHLKNFEAFVMDWLNESNIESYVHFIPQYKFITSKQNRNKILMDFIGRFEDIERDFEIVCAKLGKQPVPLQKLNIGNKEQKKYTDFYSKEMRVKVHQLYEKDIAFFQYNFS